LSVRQFRYPAQMVLHALNELLPLNTGRNKNLTAVLPMANGNQPHANGMPGHVGGVVYVQLAQDSGAVASHSLESDSQGLRNVLRGFTLGNERQDFTFAGG
jgi:hypothetical protein